MPILDLLQQTLRTLLSHRLRTGLTLFGVIWGSASVVFLVAWGRGLHSMLEAGFNRIGKDVGFVWAGAIGEEFTPATDRRQLWFELADLDALRRAIRINERVSAEADAWLAASFRGRTLSVNAHGVESAGFALRGVSVAAGRPITRSDEIHRRRVAVLGTKARERLLGPEGGVGSWIRLNGQPYRVIGLLDRVGTQLFRESTELDEQIWVPLSTFLAAGFRPGVEEDRIERILFRMPSRDRYEEASAEVRGILARRLGVSPTDEEAIAVMSPVEILNEMPVNLFDTLLLLISTTTLLIGGVGILAMMLDSIQERRQEIGVRLAVGGRRRDVLAQFFAETALISVFGGALGVSLGSLAAGALGLVEAPDLVPIPVLSKDIVFIAIGVTVFTAVASGVIPAWQATRVDPAQTLRAEG